MMEEIIKADTLLKIDQGAYSDYYVVGFFRVIKDFNWKKELDSFVPIKDRKNVYINMDKFLNQLLSKDYLLELPHNTLHLGNYGEYDSVGYYGG